MRCGEVEVAPELGGERQRGVGADDLEAAGTCSAATSIACRASRSAWRSRPRTRASSASCPSVSSST